VTMHHIVSDGWSIDVFLNELCARYTDAVGGRATPLDHGSLQYADVAAWQRHQWDTGAMTPDVAYWRQTLAGAPTLLELPTDRPRPEAQSYAGATHTTVIAPPLAALLAERTREFGVTTFMALAAVFSVALSRWSGQGDIVIGFPAAGRDRSELEPLIGMFVNTVPLRVRVDAAPTFDALLAAVRAHTLDALAHQQVPFEKLVDALGVERHLAWSPLFQVMFVMQNARAVPPLPAGLRAEPIAPPASTSTKFDLTLAIADEGDQLSASFEYDRALFEAASIERFATGFLTLLRALLGQPASRLDRDAPSLTERSSFSLDRSTSLVAPSPTDQPAASAATVTAAEQALTEIWSQVLHLDHVGLTDNFFELGGDSIVSIRIIAAMRERGWRIEPKQIFRHQTIRALAVVAEPIGASIETGVDETDRLPLTPTQQLFFALNPPSPNHFNQALLLNIDPAASSDCLRAAVREIARVHPALRSRFHRGDAGWTQDIVPDLDVAFDEHDLSSMPAAGRVEQMERLCHEAQRGLDIVTGPVFRAALFRLGSEDARLLLVAHHLVVDAVSWHIVLADLASAYAQSRRGDEPVLPAERCGPAAYRRRAATQFSGARLEAEAAYWTEIVRSAGRIFGGGAGLRDGVPPRPAVVTRTLSAAKTRTLVTDVYRAYQTNVASLLLAALGRALCQCTGRDAVLVDVEGHGRDAVDVADLSRSVGWFTAIYPVALPCGGPADSSRMIRAVKASTESVPRGGAGFGWLQWANEATGASAQVADVCFNYLGQTGTESTAGVIRGIAAESAGSATAADLPRRYQLELNAAIVNGGLVLQYSFDAARLGEDAVAALADDAMTTLDALIADVPRELDALFGDLDLSEVPEA
jgi:non-ribosomal peptide synthase protein (TIGR01720 family)